MNVNVYRAVLGVAVTGLLAMWIGASVAKPPDGKGKPGGGDTYNACVLFMDRAEDAIYSDGEVLYCHNSKEKILVAITGGSNAGFRFDSNSSTKSGGGRTVGVDFSSLADMTGCGHGEFTPRDGSESGQREVDFRIQSEYMRDGNGGWIPIGTGQLDMLAMEEGAITYAGLTSGPLLNFDPDPPGEFDCVLADPVRVERISGNAWIIDTVVGEDRAASFDVVDNDWNNPVFRGVYHMPFQMLVTAVGLDP